MTAAQPTVTVHRLILAVSLVVLCCGVSADPARAQGFPPAGTDQSPSVGILTVEIGPGEFEDVEVSGDITLQWSDPQDVFLCLGGLNDGQPCDPLDPRDQCAVSGGICSPSGLRTVQTEMLSLSLTGMSPNIGSLQVFAGSQFGLPQTLGAVTSISPDSDFPATAFFDVFFVVDIPGIGTLQNSGPLRMEAQITEIPPRNIALTNANSVQLFDPTNPGLTASLLNSFHWMCPPPFPPTGPCPVPCDQNPFPTCQFGDCPTVVEWGRRSARRILPVCRSAAASRGSRLPGPISAPRWGS